jgi:Fe-S oxidoreductase
VQLVQKPKHTILGVLAYESIAAACDDVPRLLGFDPSAVELIPQMLIHLARGVPAYAAQIDFVDGDPAALLVVEFSGDDPTLLGKQARGIGEKMRVAISRKAQEHIWNIRKVGLGIFDSGPVNARPVAFIEDCAIPVERLGDFVREVEHILDEHKTTAAFYAHASAGCLHIRPLLDLRTGQGVHNLRSIAQQVHAITLRVGGAMSSEHGDGIARSEWLDQTYGADLNGAFEALKRTADPNSILNPGKIVGAPPMDTHLRYGTGYRNSAWASALDFSRQRGLAGAIEQCNGQGVCRKADGVMCPSFQATRDEMYSTRGRANLLRALISLPVVDGPPAIEKAVYEALGLCLACKGCKAECPSGVDMAKLKYEFQNRYYRAHRRPLRDYLFGYINQLAPLGAPFGGLINLLGNWSIVRHLGSFLGLAEQRPLPKFRRAGFKLPGAFATVEEVLYLPDTFTRYFEPEIESAAMRVLAACDVGVRTLPFLGAGRTLLSKGFLDPARRHAAALLDAIQRLDPDGTMPVIGLEPSELYTLRDEFFDLLPERRVEIAALAGRAFLIDEFLIRPHLDAQKVRIANLISKSKIQNHQSKILLHGHCYQKAQPPAADGYPMGQNASAELLRTLGYDIKVIPSGCCGMAGAFGYEAEHYAVSMKVGELVLFPHIRAQVGENGSAVKVAANGTSCRAQILDGAAVNANHTIILVENILRS